MSLAWKARAQPLYQTRSTLGRGGTQPHVGYLPLEPREAQVHSDIQLSKINSGFLPLLPDTNNVFHYHRRS